MSAMSELPAAAETLSVRSPAKLYPNSMMKNCSRSKLKLFPCCTFFAEFFTQFPIVYCTVAQCNETVRWKVGGGAGVVFGVTVCGHANMEGIYYTTEIEQKNCCS